MILAIDVGYTGHGARAAGVLFADWRSAVVDREIVLDIEHVADYVPGEFYRRELPCIAQVLAKSAFAGTPDAARLYRGGSTRPLFVTAAGMALDAAKAGVAAMQGRYRLPDILKRVDQLSRGL